MKDNGTFGDARTAGHAALASYEHVLRFLAGIGTTRRHRRPTATELPFLRSVPGLENLFLSMASAAPATPGTNQEEWNPLSQRPHCPLPPPVVDELGGEITALKEAVDAFTTMSHEMMHVALWEPFFAGLWKPSGRRAFREFSLRAEGYCFFFSDIIVSGAVRARLPDGEFALERRTPSNAHFHPVRAFQSLGISDPRRILDIYLEGFNGQRTRLWQARGANNYATALAARVYEFYVGTQSYLDEAHAALAAFGCFSEFYRRFCQVSGLPTFLGTPATQTPQSADLAAYFKSFFLSGMSDLAKQSSGQLQGLRWRRMAQTRAYYALQARWLVREGLVAARAWSKRLADDVAGHIDAYLDGLSDALRTLARQPDDSPARALAQLDETYDRHVRARFSAHAAWAGHRWLIAPRRAGGLINVLTPTAAKGRQAKIELLQTVAFLVDELTRRMRNSKTVETRAATLALIRRIAALGATPGAEAAATARAARKLRAELSREQLLDVWSVPMASFDPGRNQYRELIFSYQ